MLKTRRIGFGAVAVLLLCTCVAGCLPSIKLPSMLPPDMAEIMAAPFELDDSAQTKLDHVLAERQRLTGHIEAFSCKFVVYEYDPVFGPRNGPASVKRGEFKRMPSGEMQATLHGKSDEKYVWDSKSRLKIISPGNDTRVLDYSSEKQGIRFSELSGPGAIAALLGSDPETVRARFYIRVSTPPDVKDQIWLEAFPKTQADAGWFTKVDLILNPKDMLPIGFQIPGKSQGRRTSYVIEDFVLDGRKESVDKGLDSQKKTR